MLFYHLHCLLDPGYPPRQSYSPLDLDRGRGPDLVHRSHLSGRDDEPCWALRLPPLRRSRRGNVWTSVSINL